MIRRWIRVVLGLLMAGTLFGAAPAGQAQTEAAPSLGGFKGSSAASGLNAVYGFDLLPIPPPLDLGSPDALTTIASGPTTFARASVLDPGDLLANPDAFLALASGDYPAGTVPTYPFRVSATSGFGEPKDEVTAAPGLNARVNADTNGSTAEATMPALDAPAVATVGSMASRTTTRTDGSTVTVTARSQLDSVNILGLVTIDSVLTELTATSDGVKSTFTGGTRVSGAAFMGRPVTIDEDGIHQEPGSAPLLDGVLGTLTGDLNDILARAGVRITLPAPVEVSGGASGQRGVTGVRIGFELSKDTQPELHELLGLLPPLENPIPGAPSVEDVVALARARHLASLDLGRGTVALEARPSVELAPFEPPDIAPTFTPPAVSPSLATPTLPAPSITATPRAPDPKVLASSEPEVPAGVGVGALILLALLAHPFIGELVARLSSAVLASGPTDRCTWEEP